ncbi:hypothetical protein [Sulfurimonas autotrophica]|uniref:Uncharacterized protein n=1 Tax=Sulfurimonas autotrophica (strain ATCC BAA-671 / DSM 16294 / JCM 11897 / OK10) TaxID=563040 RepID=E0UP21_SULAO|nr:hypothetical protein [Sulfurimonas autotrophica]ADN08054.1 hypothetical protein Saut_0005 [Sulfurimonas autotrophica DSM 16294]
MFAKIFGKKNKSQDEQTDSHLIEKILKMNLTEMRSYVKNSMKDFKVSVDGINEIMKKLTSLDEKTQTYYIKSDDMDVKKKKAFDLFIAILSSKQIDIQTIELAQKFLENYKEIVDDFDTRNKQIYASKLADTLNTAINTINQYVQLQKKMNVLGK